MTKVTTYGKPALGGRWTLVDFTGRPVTDVDFHNEFTLLYFGFTHCPDICPSELVKVGKVIDLLGALCVCVWVRDVCVCLV
jgi:protein SCO1